MEKLSIKREVWERFLKSVCVVRDKTDGPCRSLREIEKHYTESAALMLNIEIIEEDHLARAREELSEFEKLAKNEDLGCAHKNCIAVDHYEKHIAKQEERIKQEHRYRIIAEQSRDKLHNDYVEVRKQLEENNG